MSCVHVKSSEMWVPRNLKVELSPEAVDYPDSS